MVVASVTSRFSCSPRIVPGKMGQDDQCLLSAGQCAKSAVVWRRVAGNRSVAGSGKPGVLL